MKINKKIVKKAVCKKGLHGEQVEINLSYCIVEAKFDEMYR